MNQHVDGFFKHTKDEMLEIFGRVCQMPRFTLSIINEFGNFILGNDELASKLFIYCDKLCPEHLKIILLLII